VNALRCTTSIEKLTTALLLGCLAGACSSDKGGGASPPTSTPGVHTAFTDAELTAQKCQLTNTLTTYTAGVAGSTPASATTSMVSCYQEFGIGSAEPTLGVAKDGTVTYAPIFTADGGVGVYQSADYGTTWSATVPKLPNGGGRGKQQPYLFRDPETDLMLFATTTATFSGDASTGSGATKGFDLSRSADDWKTSTYENVALETSDWVKIYSGPPVTSQTQGYPDVIYMSAPSPISTLAGEYQAVYKSLDGGLSWTSVGGKQLSLKVADFPDCPSDGWIIYGNGGVAPNGTVYISLHRCGHLAIAVSADEGNTWKVTDVPGTTLLPFIGLIQMVNRANALLTEPLAIDSDGTLYMVWPDEAGLLRFSVSKDGAKTWSQPVVASAPAVKYAVYGGVAVKAPGTMAIAYYGSQMGIGGPFDGYMAETTNALDGAPTFASSRLNDPATPLTRQTFDVGYGRLLSGGQELNEIVKPAYAPNGDVWATFAHDMCFGLGLETDMCGTWDVAKLDNYQGAVGRLVHR
jgi:hypothetical protein